MHDILYVSYVIYSFVFFKHFSFYVLVSACGTCVFCFGFLIAFFFFFTFGRVCDVYVLYKEWNKKKAN